MTVNMMKSNTLKHAARLAVVAVAVLAVSVNAIAQPGGGGQRGQGPGMGPGMGGGPGMMMGAGGFGAVLQNPELARMLELTPAQTSELQEAIRNAVQSFRPEPGTGPPNPAEMMQRMEQIQDAVHTQARRVLNPQQQAKAQEAVFQLQGGLESPMLNVRSLDVVGLSDAQKEQVRVIVEARNAENRTAMESMMRGTDFRNMSQEDRDRLRAEGEARNKRYADQITAVLTPDQKAKAERLTAEAPALRERLGMPAPGQQQRGQGAGQGRGGQGAGFAPDSGSWRPGQQVPGAPGRGAGGQGGRGQGGGFPRPAN